MLTSRKVTILHGDVKQHKGKLFMPKIAQKLVGLFFIFLILFSFPILNVFWKGSLVFGLPLIYLYIFSIWLLLIICLIWLVEFRKK
jgi:hypothetical protein